MNEVTDVLVIGFGAAGSAAAIEAGDAGADVMILEKMRKPGGAAKMSAGVVYAAGTSVQRAVGIADTADEMYDYMVATDNHVKDPALARVLADRSGEAIEWLMKLGVDFAPQELCISGAEREYAHVTPPKPRSHHVRAVPGGSAFWTGLRLFAALERAVEARRIKVRLQTTATELVTNSMKEVVGVKAISQGIELSIRARRAVVIADGGFAQSPEMIRQFLHLAPYIAAGRIALTSHPGQTGDGIRMAMALGADLSGICWASARARPVITARYPSIWVNSRGLRFVNENRSNNSVSNALDGQGSIAFEIFDDRVMKLMASPEARSRRESGQAEHDVTIADLKEVGIPEARLRRLESAPTIGELATKLRIPAGQLENTLKLWNRHAETGEDPEFGKTGPAVAPISTPPFWGGELPRSMSVNLGGLKTNTNAQVLRVMDGTPIPRLYAAGQTTGGRFGSFYPASGSALADSFVFGRIAGQNAAAERPSE